MPPMTADQEAALIRKPGSTAPPAEPPGRRGIVGVMQRFWRALWTSPTAISSRDYYRPYVGPNDLDDYGNETDAMRRAYLDFHKSEPTMGAAVEGKVAAVAATDVTVQPEDPDSPADCRAAEFVHYAIDHSPCGWVGLITRVAEPAYVLGWSLSEMVLGPITGSKWAGLWGLADFRSLDTNWFRLHTDDYRNITSVVSIARGLRYLPRDKFCLYTHGELFGNPFGTSSYRKAYRAANLIDAAYKLWYVALSNCAHPFLKGKFKDRQNRQALTTALQEARAGGYITLPASDDVDVVNLASATSFQAFERKIDKLRQEIFLAIRGAYLPFTEGSNNVMRGNVAVTKKTGSDQLEYLACATVGQAMTRQIVPALVRPNFGPRVGLPRIVLGGVDYSEMGQQLDIGSRLLNEFKLPISKKALYRLANWQPPDDPADTLQPPAGPAPTTVPSPAPGAGLGFSDPEKKNVGQPALIGETKVPPGPTLPVDPPDGPFQSTTFSEATPVLPMAGPKGDKVARHLAATVADGSEALVKVAGAAVRRLVESGKARQAKTLFTNPELVTIAKALMQTITTADLLGRSRVADRAHRLSRRSTFAEGDQQQQGQATPGLPTQQEVIDRLPARIPALVPEAAVAYFQNLVPTLGTDPQVLLPTLQRRAFTLAVATEQTLLSKVQDAIGRALETGNTGAATPEIQGILDAAGVSPANPQYAEMVWRTNAIDSLNRGTQDQMAAMSDTFPVWQYMGIDDERERPNHRAQNNLYYSADTAFESVRDALKGDFDGFNCRCNPRPVDKYEWADLQAQGAQLSTL